MFAFVPLCQQFSLFCLSRNYLVLAKHRVQIQQCHACVRGSWIRYRPLRAAVIGPADNALLRRR